jgi:hypothetical protein
MIASAEEKQTDNIDYAQNIAGVLNTKIQDNYKRLQVLHIMYC